MTIEARIEALHEKMDALLSVNRAILRLLETNGANIMSAIDDLTAQVAANTAVEASAVTLIQGIAAELAAAATDPAKVEALAAQLKASASALGAAVAANTPAAPPAPPPTTP